MEEIKDFTAYNHGKKQIDLRDIGFTTDMRPTEIHFKEDGSLDNKPSFCIVLEAPMLRAAIGELTVEMFNDALKDIGYKLIKIK